MLTKQAGFNYDHPNCRRFQAYKRDLQRCRKIVQQQFPHAPVDQIQRDDDINRGFPAWVFCAILTSEEYAALPSFPRVSCDDGIWEGE